LGSSESPIMPRPFDEIFEPEEQPKLEQTIGTCPIPKEWVPGNSVA
jgi:peptide/nickel transport system substrate-binding protein